MHTIESNQSNHSLRRPPTPTRSLQQQVVARVGLARGVLDEAAEEGQRGRGATLVFGGGGRGEEGGGRRAELEADLRESSHQQVVDMVVEGGRGLCVLGVEGGGQIAGL